jgi:RHS repeat-associated protein
MLATFTSNDVEKETIKEFTFTVTDTNDISSTDIVTVVIKPFMSFNRAPEVSESTELLVESGDAVSVTMVASDSDGDEISYTWKQVGGNDLNLSFSNAGLLNFNAPESIENQVYIFELLVTDTFYDIKRRVTVAVKGRNKASGVFYYHNDHLGTPQALTDDSGRIVWEADYSPFGEVNIVVNEIINNIRFPGQYFDEESGLHYNYFRDYDPELGRYIQSDRLGLFDGPNTYGYAHQNPIMYTDPTGEFVPQLLGFVIGAGLEYLTNDCASTTDILLAGALGSVGGGIGAKLGLKFAGNKGLNKQFSHFIPSRYIRKSSEYYKPWLDNKLGRWLIKGHNKWNGNYVHVKRHFKHDPFAWGNRAFPGKTLGEKWNSIIGRLDRVPNSWRGTAAGIGVGAGTGQLAPKSGECGCGT